MFDKVVGVFVLEDGKYFVLVVESDNEGVGIVTLVDRVELVVVVLMVVDRKAVDLVVEMYDNLAGIFEVVDGKNIVSVVESNDEVVFEAVVGDDMVAGVDMEKAGTVVVLVEVGIVVVIVDVFAIVEGQFVVLVEVVLDEIVGVVVVVDGKNVVLVVERDDEVANAVKKEDRKVSVFVVCVCVIEMIYEIVLVEVGRVDWVVVVFVVVKWLSVVLVEVVVEVFADVVVIECGNLLSIEGVGIVDVVVGVDMVEKG